MAVRSAKELGLHVEHIHAGKLDWKPVIFEPQTYRANSSFPQAFEGSTYPLKTNQGKWIASLINFYIETIMRSKVRQVTINVVF